MNEIYYFRINGDTPEFTTRPAELPMPADLMYPANPLGYRELAKQVWQDYLNALQEGKIAYLDENGDLIIEDPNPTE